MKSNLALGALIGLFLTLSLWFIMLYGIISSIDAPVWLWAIFWVYVLLIFILAFIAKLIERMDD